jgi:hypothetical protein
MHRLALLLLISFSLAAQQRSLPPIPRYEVHRARTAVVVDGKLDDAAWKAAGTIEFRFPWDKQTGAKQKTVARLLWDDNYLYVGYDCEDTDITAHYTERDDPTYKDDAVELFLNPDPTQEWYYGMEMNARRLVRLLLRISPNAAEAHQFLRCTARDPPPRHSQHVRR